MLGVAFRTSWRVSVHVRCKQLTNESKFPSSAAAAALEAMHVLLEAGINKVLQTLQLFEEQAADWR